MAYSCATPLTTLSSLLTQAVHKTNGKVATLPEYTTRTNGKLPLVGVAATYIGAVMAGDADVGAVMAGDADATF